MSEDQIRDHFNQLSGELPEECVELLKSFYNCKLKHDDELFKDKDAAFINNYQFEPFSRVEGCKNIWDKFHKCKEDFTWRYINMKNYVAQVEAQIPPYNKEAIKADLKENLTEYNFGLYKF
jgi:hypothetical protein